jgi:hypothetical protein
VPSSLHPDLYNASVLSKCSKTAVTGCPFFFESKREINVYVSFGLLFWSSLIISQIKKSFSNLNEGMVNFSSKKPSHYKHNYPVYFFFSDEWPTLP